MAITSVLALLGSLFLPASERRVAPAEDGGKAPGPFHVGPLAALLVAQLLLLASYGGFITTYAPLATTRLGWSILDVGVAFSFFGGGSIVIGPPLAHLADRLGRKPMATAAPLALCLFGIALVAGLPQPAVYALAFLAGGGLTAFGASWYALLADTAGERRIGRTFGVVNAISSLGIVAGSLTAAQLWERVDLSAGMLVAAVSPLLAGAAMLAYRRPAPLPSPA